MRATKVLATNKTGRRSYEVQIKLSLKDKLRFLFQNIIINIEFHELGSVNRMDISALNKRGYLAIGGVIEQFPKVGNKEEIRK